MPLDRDTLDAFFHPDPSSAVRDVLRVATALARGESQGEIRRASLVTPRRHRLPRMPPPTPPTEHAWLTDLRPYPGGPLCEEVFGPISAESRSVRVGHIHLTTGVVHPALLPAIGAALGISEEQARTNGGRALEAQLVEANASANGNANANEVPEATRVALAALGLSLGDLVLHDIPVVPPGQRALAVEDGQIVAGNVNALYQRILEANEVIQLISNQDREELYGPTLTQWTERQQRAFEKLCGELGGASRESFWDDPEPDRVAERPLSGPPVDPCPDPDAPHALTGAAILGPDSLLLVFSQSMLQFARADGAVRGVYSAPSCEIAWVDGIGDRVMIQGHQVHDMGDWSAVQPRFFPFDLGTGSWEGEVPDDFIPTFFGEIQETSWLADERTGRALQLLEVAQYADRRAFTPDHRFLWVEDKEGSGGVYFLGSGQLHAMFAGQRRDSEVATLHRDGSWADPRAEDAETWVEASADHYGGNQRPPCAIVRIPRGTFRTYDDGLVAEDDAPLFRVPQHPLVAAFSRSGEELLLIDRDEVIVYFVGAGRTARVLARYATDGAIDSWKDEQIAFRRV